MHLPFLAHSFWQCPNLSPYWSLILTVWYFQNGINAVAILAY